MTHFYTQVHESLISMMINGFGHVTIAHFNSTHYSHVKNGVESPNASEAIQSDNNKFESTSYDYFSHTRVLEFSQ